MQSNRRSWFAIAAALAVSFFLPSAMAAGAGAKAGLAQAQAQSLAWKPDAILVQVMTLSGNADGTAEKWAYLFHSPQSKRGYRVDVKNGKVDRTLETSAGLRDRLDAEFIDSMKAVAEAKANGLQVKTPSMMTLHTMYTRTKREGPYWSVFGSVEDTKATIIDGRTGKFVRKE